MDPPAPPPSFDALDRRISEVLRTWGVPALRYSLALVFLWFGALKLFDLSPAADLVRATVYWFDPDRFLPVLGIWEMAIGACLLHRPLIRVAIPLLLLQMPGTMLPLVLLPDATFTRVPYGLTIEGQYIVKNLVLVSAALVIGGTVRAEGTARAGGRAGPTAGREGEPGRGAGG